MSVVTLFKCGNLPKSWMIQKSLNGKKFDNSWLTAFVSKYNRNEVVVNYWYQEDLEDSIKRVLEDENETSEVVSFLKQNGKTQVVKRIHCFINLTTKTLEIYTGSENKANEIISIFENILKVKFERIILDSNNLQKIYSEHSTELKQVMFKNIDGLLYEILRGKNLENNEKFKDYIQKFPNCLRVISFRPKIKFLNGNTKYQVTLNGDKGTIKFSSPNGEFNWRPRIEIRQLTFLVAATVGLLG